MKTATMLAIVFFVWILLCSAVYTRSKFKSAVYEHAVILPIDRQDAVSREEALKLMKQNLAVYAKQAAEAKRRGVDILVFPEDGVYGMGFTRVALEPYLEFIPDPEVEDWTPCDDPSRYPNTEVQYELSCMAKRHQLYIVANIGDRQPCHKDTRDCPDDLHFQFNTNVAYDPQGRLVARYHKRHLFFEKQFDTPPAKVVSFDTPFGRWGMFICFDILFYDPAVTSVQREGIANIAFPTAWMDALPLLASVEFHSAFARRFGVNFLAANIHRPAYRFHGSGIYTAKGQAAFYHNATLTSEPRLIVAELDVAKRPAPEDDAGLNISSTTASSTQGAEWLDTTLPSSAYSSGNSVSSGTDPQTLPDPSENVAHLHETAVQDNSASELAFVSVLFYDLYNFVQLEESHGTLHVCNNKLCCRLSYSLTRDPEDQDLFAFGAFDGNHTQEGNYYLQICALVRCANQSRHSCGSPTNQSATLFHSLNMSGSFETDYVFPEVLLTTETDHLRLAEPEEWKYSGNSIHSLQGFRYPLLAAALFGRDYSRDKEFQTIVRPDDAAGGVSPLHGQWNTWILRTGAVLAVLYTYKN